MHGGGAGGGMYAALRRNVAERADPPWGANQRIARQGAWLAGGRPSEGRGGGATVGPQAWEVGGANKAINNYVTTYMCVGRRCTQTVQGKSMS